LLSKLQPSLACDKHPNRKGLNSPNGSYNKATQTPALEASKNEEYQLTGKLLLNIQCRQKYLWHMGTSQMPLHTDETSDDVTSSFVIIRYCCAVAYEDKLNSTVLDLHPS